MTIVYIILITIAVYMVYTFGKIHGAALTHKDMEEFKERLQRKGIDFTDIEEA